MEKCLEEKEEVGEEEEDGDNDDDDVDDDDCDTEGTWMKKYAAFFDVRVGDEIFSMYLQSTACRKTAPSTSSSVPSSSTETIS